MIFSGLYLIRVQITGCAAAFKSLYLIRVMDADKSWSRHLLHCKLAGKGFFFKWTNPLKLQAPNKGGKFRTEPNRPFLDDHVESHNCGISIILLRFSQRTV